VPALFVINATLSNSRILSFQEDRVITGANSGLDFSPAALTGEVAFTRRIVNQYDRLLYVPAATGDYSLKANFNGGSLALYDVEADYGYIDDDNGMGEIALVKPLEAGKPYLIIINSFLQFETYQFRAVTVQPVNLGGTLNLSGLAPLGDTIASAAIQVYEQVYDDAVPVLAEPATVGENGSWSAVIPAIEPPRTVRIEARISLQNGQTITAHTERTISGNTSGLNLAPAAVTGPLARVSGSSNYEDSFLLVPPNSGSFNLGVSGGYFPTLTLYDAAGEPVFPAVGSLYELTAGTPYIVVVNGIGSFMAYQFVMRQVQSLSIGGSVNYDGLPSSLRAIIGSARVSGYSADKSSPIFPGAAVSENAWSATVSPALAGQTVHLTLTLTLTNGRVIPGWDIQGTLNASAGDLTLNFAPSAVTSPHDGTAPAGQSAWLLWVPVSEGLYVLDAEKTNLMDPYMCLYDGITGALIAEDDDGGGNANARIEYADFEAHHPYFIQVRDPYNNANGSFQFRATKQ
jgi:hypothetical protein